MNPYSKGARMDAKLLNELLHEEESATLDFKRDQYPFVGADDSTKSELLKDVLAMANAWRRAETFILIGVEDVRGGRSNPLGVTTQHDDATLQQFVISSTIGTSSIQALGLCIIASTNEELAAKPSTTTKGNLQARGGQGKERLIS
jgi:hypothetical protein